MNLDSELFNDIPGDAQSAEDVTLPTDAAERKRVLNILAQRRYRRRRRERQNTLENLVKNFEKPSKAPRQERQEQSLNNIQNNSNSTITSTSTPSSNSSDALLPLTWPDPDYDTWAAGTFDLSTDITLSDTARTTSETSLQLNEFLQNDDILNATFADDFHIAVPELDLLRAAYEIASRIQSAQLLFDLSAQSVFLTSDCSSWVVTLPKNLQPTTAQLTIPHHPLIDILPWPSVRTKLISMYNLPVEVWPRHPNDGTESCLLRMVYDMEDGGIRVTGPDPSQEIAWEIEQKMFEAWWWCLDQRIVDMSNKKRAARGLPRLAPR